MSSCVHITYIPGGRIVPDPSWVRGEYAQSTQKEPSPLRDAIRRCAQAQRHGDYAVLHIDRFADLGRHVPQILFHVGLLLSQPRLILVIHGEQDRPVVISPLDDDAVRPVLGTSFDRWDACDALVHLDKIRSELASLRAQSGAAKAKKKGTVLGRRRLLTESQEREISERAASGDTVESLAAAFEVSRQTIMRTLDRYDGASQITTPHSHDDPHSDLATQGHAPASQWWANDVDMATLFSQFDSSDEGTTY